MTHLTATQRARLEQRLRTREQALQDDVHREIGKEDEQRLIAGEARDAADFAIATLLNDLTTAEIERDVRELRAIAVSLQRLHGAGYGVCADCNEEIPYERLLAQPTAVRCNRCQSRHERTFAGAGRGPTL